MRHALSVWQNKIGDIGLIPEAEIEILEHDAGSRFEILHGNRGDSPVENRLATLVEIATSASEGPARIPQLLDALGLIIVEPERLPGILRARRVDQPDELLLWRAVLLARARAAVARTAVLRHGAAPGSLAQAVADPARLVRLARDLKARHVAHATRVAGAQPQGLLVPCRRCGRAHRSRSGRSPVR